LRLVLLSVLLLVFVQQQRTQQVLRVGDICVRGQPQITHGLLQVVAI
jgi:hypothetical protein